MSRAGSESPTSRAPERVQPSRTASLRPCSGPSPRSTTVAPTKRTTIASPRLLVIILRARIAAIRRYRLSFDSVKAVGSLVSEVATIVTRAPLWEWRYRWRFRSPRPA